ncbi:MAG: hypothetical protein ACTSUE_24000 [Promethearchaeota archaeon]
MIVVFWIALVAILVMIGYFLTSIIKIKIKPRWGLVPTDYLIRKEISIDTGTGKLKGYLYTSTDFKNSPGMPGVIVLPRRDKKFPFFEHWGAHFALQGFPTLCVELSGIKSARPEFVEKIVSFFPQIKGALIKNSDANPEKIAIMGEEDAAEAAVYAGLKDENVKMVCVRNMHALNQEQIDGDSGKIALAHAKDDDQVMMDEFETNRGILGLSDRDYLLLDLGGHHMNSQEAVVSGFFSIKLHQALKPVYKQVENKSSGVVA